MRTKQLLLGGLFVAMIAGSASAATIQSGGAPSWGLNWGTYNGAGTFAGVEWLHNTVALTPNSGYRSATGVNDADSPGHDVVNPGAGGQNYDAEEIFYYFNAATNSLHLGLMTGFNPYGEVGDFASPFYRGGDLFVDLGGNGDYNIAIGVGLGSPTAGTNLEGGTRAGSAWYGSWTVGNDINHMVSQGLIPVAHDGIINPGNTTTNFSISNPYRVDETNANVFALSSVDYAYTRVWQNAGSGLAGPQPTGTGNRNEERWFYEYRLQLNPNGPLGGLIETLTNPNGGLGLHWTQGCGNDRIQVMDGTPFAPLVPIPAAAPMVLLGMAVVGVARKFRGAK